jgi:hypothetical protein
LPKRLNGWESLDHTGISVKAIFEIAIAHCFCDYESVLIIVAELRMDNDFALFLVAVGVLILYLVFSALTEMGTKLPWKK